jgi:hypothetical protein
MEIGPAIVVIFLGIIVTIVGIALWRDLRPRRSAGQQIDAQRQRELNEQYGQTGVDREFNAYGRDARGGGS